MIHDLRSDGPKARWSGFHSENETPNEPQLEIRLDRKLYRNHDEP
jgi:hypothetical protein